MSKNSSTLIAIAVLVVCQGCAIAHLRRNTTNQAGTLTDIYEQQVLNNLAMFVVNPDSLPSFAYPNSGGSDVSGEASLGSDTTWKRLGFDAEVLKLNGKRGMKGAWTMQPVYDVRRLELMRSAYQQVLVNCGFISEIPICPDADRLQRTFYLGAPDAKYDEDPAFDHLGTFSAKTGRTTPACFAPVCWIQVGKKKCNPLRPCCVKIGSYCGTQICVPPGGQDELTKLTLAILDYAFSPQAVRSNRTKEVTWYFGKDGLPTEQENAAQVMKATVPFNARVRLNTEGADLPADFSELQDHDRKQMTDTIDGVFDRFNAPDSRLPLILPPPTGILPLQFELNRRFLTPDPLSSP